MQGEALALPLEQVVGCKHAYVYANPTILLECAANLKVRPSAPESTMSKDESPLPGKTLSRPVTDRNCVIVR